MSGPRLISVIVPTRNAAATIDACLDSLCSQTFQDFEICLIDGQSSDATISRVQARAAATGREVKWISEPDAGAYDAMNKGIARAAGEWLYFLGADDALHDPGVLADMAREMAPDDADLLYGDVVFRDSGERYGGEFTLERLLFEGNLCHQAAFYRRSMLDKLGRYCLRYPIWADWELNIRLFRHPDCRPRWIDRRIAFYRPRAGLSSQEDPNFRKELPAILNNEITNLRDQLQAVNREIAALRKEVERVRGTLGFQVHETIARWLG